MKFFIINSSCRSFAFEKKSQMTKTNDRPYVVI